MPNFAILNNKTAFPNIQNLPWENEVPLRYYPEYGGSPIRHWCFLGEITQHIGFGRITVRVKDRAGKETTLAFYPETDEDVKGVKDIQEYQIGHTIAVLYPCRRQFLDMSTGIRLETMSNHEVIPLPLADILALPKTYDKKGLEEALTTCAGCGETETRPAKRCGQCRLRSYCNEECQRKDWTDNGHKAKCQGLTIMSKMCHKRRNWDRWVDWFSFPM